MGESHLNSSSFLLLFLLLSEFSSPKFQATKQCDSYLAKYYLLNNAII